ncbi:hypothetical protein ACS5PU_13095 [Pedobacter sp. GSP4]|uniref:hypothetical protein n=1 Tax=Pedobacter sp. GSP4 TaxID=3453716 RepID=UPI003EED8251
MVNALARLSLLLLMTGLLCTVSGLGYASNLAWVKDAPKTRFINASGVSTGFMPPSYAKHYIAPAPWQYWSKANEIVITTDNPTTVSGTIKKSDGTVITAFSCAQGNPFTYRFSGLPKDVPAHSLNTVISAAGIIVEATASISVNLRNVASDNLGSDGSDSDIKGNASLFSFGDAAIGTSFRVGYYRDGDLAGSAHKPIYSIMATENNTIVKIGGVATATLNAGQSYLFKAVIGTLVESSASAVMNTSAALDAPGGCGDGAFNPIPPISSLGKEYVIVKGEGNAIAEQTTVIATEANTVVNIVSFDANGVQKTTQTFLLAQPGDKQTFNHGYINGAYNTTSNTGRYSSSLIVSDKNIEVFSGTGGVSGGGGCEVDIATLVPITGCSGSKSVETTKFTGYVATNNLSYFGYILTKSADPIVLSTIGGSPAYTNTNIETISGIGARKPLGSSGLSLISFTHTAIGQPRVISISSLSRLTVSMVQQSSGFSMSNFISRFPEKAEQPNVSQVNCASATLTAVENAAPYQWYLNGTAINGATSNTFEASTSGNYSVSYQLECGTSAPSLPVNLTLCNIDRAITKTVDVAYPELNTDVVFTLKAENLGNGNAVGVSVNDKLPAGYTYVSSAPSPGTLYDALSGIWTIGDLAASGSVVLKITAKVVQTGVLTNTATITGSQPDQVTVNDQSSVSTSTGSGDRIVCLNTAMDPIIYSIPPSTSNVTVGGLPAGVTFNYNSSTQKLTISGTPTIAGTPATYTVSSISGTAFNATGTITVNGNVGTPVFGGGLTDKRCIGAGTDTYTATATNTTAIVYSLLPLSAGLIDAATGQVTWSAGFNGPATITATAKGCEEKQQDFVVTVSLPPALTLDADPEICQGFNTAQLNYTSPLNSPITYSISWATAGFVAVNNMPLPIGSIAINVPSDAAVGNHPGVLKIKNAGGCTTEINFNIKIKPKPSAPHVLLNPNSQY